MLTSVWHRVNMTSTLAYRISGVGGPQEVTYNNRNPPSNSWRCPHTGQFSKELKRLLVLTVQDFSWCFLPHPGP